MIYLFCNQKYGLPFLQASNIFAKDNNIDITVVMSDHITFPSNIIRKLIYYTKYLMNKKLREFRCYITFGMRVIITNDINSQIFKNKIKPNDHGVVAGFNQIFKADTISRFGSLVNFHPSLLPLYRGPVPSYWCLKYGEKRTGFTMHTITDRIDTGDILYQDLISIDQGDDESSLDYKIAKQASLVMCNYLKCIVYSQEWPRVTLDAYKEYSHHINYASFPTDQSH